MENFAQIFRSHPIPDIQQNQIPPPHQCQWKHLDSASTTLLGAVKAMADQNLWEMIAVEIFIKNMLPKSGHLLPQTHIMWARTCATSLVNHCWELACNISFTVVHLGAKLSGKRAAPFTSNPALYTLWHWSKTLNGSMVVHTCQWTHMENWAVSYQTRAARAVGSSGMG